MNCECYEWKLSAYFVSVASRLNCCCLLLLVLLTTSTKDPVRTERKKTVPVDGPPVDGPPVDGPPVDGPPVDGPPVDGPPVDGPPVDGPPVDGPLVDAPPVDGPLLDGPPVDGPPLDGPIVDKPPVDGPPVNGPPVNGPPVDGPPACTTASTVLGSSGSPERTRSTNDKLVSQHRAAKTGIQLERGRGSGRRQMRVVSERGPMHPPGRRLNEGSVSFVISGYEIEVVCQFVSCISVG